MFENQLDDILSAIENDGKKAERLFWKPDSNFEGEVQVRLLPPNSQKGEKTPYFRHMIHYVNGKSFECINQTLVDANGDLHKAESCPFCNMKEKLYKKGQKGSEEWTLAGKLKPKNTYDYRGLIRESDSPLTSRIIRLPIAVHDEVIEKLKAKRHGNIFDFKDGRDIIIIKKGKGMTSKYSMDLGDKGEAVSKSDAEEFVPTFKALDYNVLIQFPTKEECESALAEFLGTSNESDTEVNEILKTSVNKVQKTRVDQNDDFDYETEKEEEFIPVKKEEVKKTVSKKAVETEEVDSDDAFSELFGG